jgi:phosphorylcholine metabolism protein LicD
MRLGLNATERGWFRDVLIHFDRICAVANVTYFLYGGTLLGYRRSGTVLPWDDDMDVAIDAAQLESFVDGAKYMVAKHMRYINISIDFNICWYQNIDNENYNMKFNISIFYYLYESRKYKCGP